MSNSPATGARATGRWRWNEERRTLQFCPDKTSQLNSYRQSVTVLRSPGHMRRPTWPDGRTRTTWPSLAYFWDSFGTEPVNSACREISLTDSRAIANSWLQICFSEKYTDHRLSRSSLATARKSVLFDHSATATGFGTCGQDRSQSTSQVQSNIQLSPLIRRQSFLVSPNPMLDSEAAATSRPTSRHGTTPTLERAMSVINDIASRPTSSRSLSLNREEAEEVVTLPMIKEVALIELGFTTTVPCFAFLELLESQSVDRFLLAVFNYTNTFLSLRELQLTANKEEFSFEGELQASSKRQEKEKLEEQLSADHQIVSTLYSKLLLGQLKEVFHHNAKGSWRSSRTQPDQMLFEALFSFVIAATWIVLGRQNWTAITEELGRIFRSEHFNISGRLVNLPPEPTPTEILRRRRAIIEGRVWRSEPVHRVEPIRKRASALSPATHSVLRSDWVTEEEIRSRCHRLVGIIGKPLANFNKFLESE